MIRNTFLLFLFVFLTFHLMGQTDSRPKIGLVLSGGGAKGMAHIGILKELERLGIRPDYITGTSMGSIIGGLYAAGYSADEIEQIALSMDWDELLSNKTTLDRINFEEKEFYDRYIVELGIRKGKFELPQGLIVGQRLSETLSRLTRHVHDIEDFNNLPIPFACVGTDIEKGLPVVLNKGSLPLALRASMAIPSIFTPVEIDGKLLVDGGLVRNFPVPECRDMGADIIIGVFVSGGLLKKDELGTAVDVLMQSAFVLSAFDSEDQKTKCDLLIEPDISNFSTMGFEDTPAIIKSGEEAAEKARPALQALADSLGIRAEDQISVDLRPRKDSVRIRQVIVLNNEHIPDAYVVGRMRIDPNTTISIQEIERRIDAVFGTGYFEKLIYTLQANDEGTTDLVLTAEESYQAQVKFAIHYDSENKVGATVNFTRRNLIPASRLVVEADIAENARGQISFLKYIGIQQTVAVQTGINYRNSDIPNLESGENEITGVFRNRYFNPYFGLLQNARSNYLVSVTGQYESTFFTPKIGGEDIRTINEIDWKSWSLKLAAERNTMNHRYFPTHGSVYSAKAKLTLSGDFRVEFITQDTLIPVSAEVDPFLALRAGHRNIWKLSPWLSFGLSNQIIMNMIDRDSESGSLPYFNDQILIGGYRPLLVNSVPFWGAEQTQFAADHLFYNELMLQFNPMKDIYIQVVSQYINAKYPMKWIYPDFSDLSYALKDDHHALLGYGAMLSYASVLGPVSVGIASYNRTSEWNAFFSIGFYF